MYNILYITYKGRCSMEKPLVAVVGRPNVGKSTLFNKICGRRISIVKDQPGVTRDRIFGDGEWCGYAFSIVDTGGLDVKEKGDFQKNITRQAELAVEVADGDPAVFIRFDALVKLQPVAWCIPVLVDHHRFSAGQFRHHDPAGAFMVIVFDFGSDSGQSQTGRDEGEEVIFLHGILLAVMDLFFSASVHSSHDVSGRSRAGWGRGSE